MCNYYFSKKKKSKFEIEESMNFRMSSNRTNSWQMLSYSPADTNESITLELPRPCKLDQFTTFMSW